MFVLVKEATYSHVGNCYLYEVVVVVVVVLYLYWVYIF